MRGKHPPTEWTSSDRGSIPACAGETDRPRTGRPTDKGLSPLVRGKRCLSLCLPVPGGSIPACAGETLDLLLIFCLCWVYPRLCGGNCCSVALPLCWPGLSPLVRGKQFLIVNRQFLIGSIPACAGETPLHRQGSRWRRVYPRLCGGNGNTMTQTYTQEGLSPLVRGKPIPPFVPGSARRSIPACAGETSSPAPTPRATRVYPRLCGGNSCIQHYDLLKKNGFSILIC